MTRDLYPGDELRIYLGRRRPAKREETRKGLLPIDDDDDDVVGRRRRRTHTRGGDGGSIPAEHIYFGDYEYLSGDIYSGVTARAHVVELTETADGWTETDRWTRQWTTTLAGQPSIDTKLGDGIYIAAYDRIWRINNINGDGFQEWVSSDMTAERLGPVGGGSAYFSGFSSLSNLRRVWRLPAITTNATPIFVGNFSAVDRTGTYRLPRASDAPRTGDVWGYLEVDPLIIIGGQLVQIAELNSGESGASYRESWLGYYVPNPTGSLSNVIAREQHQLGRYYLPAIMRAVVADVQGTLWEVIEIRSTGQVRLNRRGSYLSDATLASVNAPELAEAYAMAVSDRYVYVAADHPAREAGVLLARRYDRETLAPAGEIIYTGPRYADDPSFGWYISGLSAKSL